MPYYLVPIILGNAGGVPLGTASQGLHVCFYGHSTLPILKCLIPVCFDSWPDPNPHQPRPMFSACSLYPLYPWCHLQGLGSKRSLQGPESSWNLQDLECILLSCYPRLEKQQQLLERGSLWSTEPPKSCSVSSGITTSVGVNCLFTWLPTSHLCSC